MFALLPPSSSVTRLTCRAHPAITCWPTDVDPVKTTFRTSGWSTKRCPTIGALARQHLEDPLGDAGLEGELTEADRRQRGELGGLEHDGAAGRQSGGESPSRDRHGEVPRHDDADHADGLGEGDVDAAGDRDLAAEQPFRRRGVIVQDVADVARLPARVADRVAGAADLEPGELLDVPVDGVGEAPQQACAVPGGHGAPRGQRRRRAGDRLVRRLGVEERDGGDDVLRRRVEHLRRDSHSRSNPLTRSQSVTAASNAASSTSAALT